MSSSETRMAVSAVCRQIPKVGAVCGNSCAVQNGELNPRFRRGKPGEVLPGQPSYRTVKALWDKSMMVKRGLGEHARPNALQGPRDMVKA
jgi:hypothetical protein